MGAPTPRGKRVVLTLLTVGAAVALLLGGAAWKAYRFERHLAFEAPPLDETRPEDCGLAGALDVEYGRSEGAPLRAWYLPSTNGAAIVFVPGAGGDRRGLAQEAALLHGAGYGVLLPDLPGRGASGGRMTSGRTEEDAVVAAVDWLARQGVARIGGLGFSLGSMFLARAAAVDPRLRAVVLEATSSSIIERIHVVQGRKGWLTALPASIAFFQEGTNPWHHAATESAAAIAPRPILLVAGRRDKIASVDMAHEIQARAGPSARLEIFETEHGGYWEADRARYAALLLSFFAENLRG